MRLCCSRRPPPNKALQLTWHTAVHSILVAFWHSTGVPQPPPAACATQLSAQSVRGQDPKTVFCSLADEYYRGIRASIEPRVGGMRPVRKTYGTEARSHLQCRCQRLQPPHGEYEPAIAEAQRAVALDPNYADSYWDLATVLTVAGRPEEAIEVMEKAMRLNPHAPAFYFDILGVAFFSAGRYEEGIAALKKAVSRNPNYLWAHLNLATAYSQSGREEEARAEAAEVLRIDPTCSLEGLRRIVIRKDQAVSERYLAALRKAGLK
jgi:tetratricopeptide (TPR) repeat protein